MFLEKEVEEQEEAAVGCKSKRRAAQEEEDEEEEGLRGRLRVNTVFTVFGVIKFYIPQMFTIIFFGMLPLNSNMLAILISKTAGSNILLKC